MNTVILFVCILLAELNFGKWVMCSLNFQILRLINMYPLLIISIYCPAKKWWEYKNLNAKERHLVKTLAFLCGKAGWWVRGVNRWNRIVGRRGEGWELVERLSMTFAANGKQPLDIGVCCLYFVHLRAYFYREKRESKDCPKKLIFFSLAVTLPWMNIFEKK